MGGAGKDYENGNMKKERMKKRSMKKTVVILAQAIS